MKQRGAVPVAVFSDAVQERIGKRRVRSAVFTTYSFDPGFFELNVLPLLFDQSFNNTHDKLRRIQLEDALREVDEVAVYYDRQALAQDAEPPQLDFRRIDVRRATGCFHPKVILLLVDEDQEKKPDVPKQSLIVIIASANLTRGGWWENVECAHIEEIADQDVDDTRCPFRRDLLALIQRIRDSAYSQEDILHRALDKIREFLRERTTREQTVRARVGGVFRTRIFCGQGQESLPKWLEGLGLRRLGWNLEIVSPYFDEDGTRTIGDILEVIKPRETRLYLPAKSDGTLLVSKITHEAVKEQRVAGNVWWSRFPSDVTARKEGVNSGKQLPRFVHAKVYRFWNAKEGRDLLLIGSPNLTRPAHSHGAAGNLEAAFLVDVSREGYPRHWWLEKIDKEEEPTYTESAQTEQEGFASVPVDVTFRYDWITRELSYQFRGDTGVRIDVYGRAGQPLFIIAVPREGSWIVCSNEEAERVREELRSGALLLVRQDGREWRVLVQEEGFAGRPSPLLELTPEEILEYWSQLNADQRAALTERHFLLSLSEHPRAEALLSRETMFSRFAGVFHAFGQFREHIAKAVKENRPKEVHMRLTGEKYDSLPVLIHKTQKAIDVEGADNIPAYITLLCAKQTHHWVRKAHGQFLKKNSINLGMLDLAIEGSLVAVRRKLPLKSRADQKFLRWYQKEFLKELGGA